MSLTKGTSYSAPTTTIATVSTVVQSKDYDWVLPVVIVLGVLIVVLFVLVLLLCKRQQWLWLGRKRSRTCCDHKQGIELDEFGSGLPLTTQNRKGSHEPIKKFERFSKVFNTKKYDSSSLGPELADFKTRYMITDEQTRKLHSHAFSETENGTPSQLTQNQSPSSPNARSDQTESNTDKNKNNCPSDHSFENNFGDSVDPWGQKANFYINNENKSGGIDNQAFWDSDLESVESNRAEDKKLSKGYKSIDQFQKCPSCVDFVGETKTSSSLRQMDRQFSNKSAPNHSCQNDDSPKLRKPLGKFETVYNLANTDYSEAELPPFQKTGSENSEYSPVDSQCNDRNSPRVMEFPKFQIPTIILPPGDRLDFGFHRYEDSTSYYNSSSLESCVSTNSGLSHRRISRANNPFSIEGVSLPRPSSAPCLFTSESQSQSHNLDNHSTSFSRSTSVSHPLVADIDDNLLHSGLRSQCISSSWSSEFYELVRDAGITDSGTQKRMKKMIDDRYHFLFDKKYPELQSLYSSVQNVNRDTDYASEKRSFSKHRKCKAKMAKKRNHSLDSDGYDRLKPPRMIYSEARPPTQKLSGNEERRKSVPRLGKRLNNSFINSSYGISSPGDDIPDDISCVSEPVMRTRKNVNGRRRDNSAETIYEKPWDLRAKSYGAFHPLRLLQASRSLQFEPQYESINMAKPSEKSSKADMPNSKDKDTVIYDHIHSEQNDKHLASKDNQPSMSDAEERIVEKELPTPPSSPPPMNPKLLKNSFKPIKRSMRNRHRSATTSEKCPDEVREPLGSDRISPENSVTDFPSDTIWRRSSCSDLINTKSFDSEAFHRTRFERTTSFISSSCDTPLEHPSSDEEDIMDADDGSRRQSFHKDIMYTHTDDDDDDDDSDSDGSSIKCFQRMTTPVEYDKSVTISKV